MAYTVVDPLNGGAAGNMLTPASILSGKYRIVALTVTPDAATGNITLTNFGTVDFVIGSFGGTLTANCYSLDVFVDGTTANKIDFELWKAGGTAADTAFLPVNIIAIVH